MSESMREEEGPAGFVRVDDRSKSEAREAARLSWKFEEAQRLTALDRAGRALYLSLAAVRRRLAAEEKLPAYHILSNRLLLTLAEEAPTDEASMAALPGFGRMRVAAYGAELLQVIRRAGASG